MSEKRTIREGKHWHADSKANQESKYNKNV